jgi:hypothetical protein
LVPNVAKGPRILIASKIYPTRLIGENTDLGMLKILGRVASKFTHVFALRFGEIRVFVEMRVLPEGKTSFILEAAEIPKDFL